MTKFKITEIGPRIGIKISGEAVVLDQEYDIALQSATTIENLLNVPAEPFSYFKYKIIKDNVTSINEATVQISFEVDPLEEPSLINEIKNVSLNDYFYFTDVIISNKGFDRVKIISKTGKGKWLISGIEVILNKSYFYYELFNLFFVADETGIPETNNYNKLEFVLGNKNNFYTTVHSIETKVSSLAIFTGYTYEIYNDNVNGIRTINAYLAIENGISNGEWEVEIDTTNFVGIGMNQNNKVTIVPENDLSIQEFTTSGVFNLSGTGATGLTTYGTKNFYLQIINSLTYYVSGFLKITLIETGTNTIDPLKKEIIIEIPLNSETFNPTQ